MYIARAMWTRKIGSAVVLIDSDPARPLQSDDQAALLSEGLLLGQYRIRSYRKDQVQSHAISDITYAYITAPAAQAHSQWILRGIERAECFADGTNYARDLTNAPGNLLVPENLAQEAAKLAERHGFGVEILDERAIDAEGMGGLYHVGKGSVNPPRMITLKYQGKPEWEDVWGLVGKGITFDTGGISMKQPEGMEEMISDMGGAATLLGFMEIVGRLKPRQNILVVIPSAENMPSGGALKPGDVIPTLSGRTVEVLNTDAEAASCWPME